MGKLVDTIDGVTGKFSEFSRSARESISLISGEAIGLTSKIEGITNAIGVTNKIRQVGVTHVNQLVERQKQATIMLILH